jgi:hypothetical protein
MVCVATLGFAAFGVAGIPDLANSTATTAATEKVSVYTLPDASGNRIDACQRISDAVPQDATITVTLLDGQATPAPVFNYPFEDIWLETSLGGLVKCPGGTTADFNTNINGVTIFAAAVFAYNTTNGTTERCQVYVNGSPLTSAGSDMDIQFNSADMDLTGIVDISDLIYFVPHIALGAPYFYGADFYYDGTVDISDLVFFAQGIGAACP